MAPASAYLILTFNTYKTGLVLHSRAIPTDDKATLLDRFYLDELFISIDGDGGQGFTGICYPSTFNYDMHNPNRIGAGRHKDGVMFLDAGLNTLGITDTPTVINKQSGAHSFSGFFKSSYYNQTTAHHFRVKRIVGGTPNFNQVYSFGVMNRNTSATKTGTTNPNTFDFDAGDYIEFNSELTNEEGTYSSNIVSFTVEPRVYTATFNSSYASYACNNTHSSTSVTVYVSNWKLGDGVNLYADLGMADVVDPGFYSINDRWYEVEADFMLGSFITDQDDCGVWRSSDPAWIPPYQTKSWIHYETTLMGSGEGCFTIDVSGTLEPKTTYRNLNNNKHYATSAGAIAEGVSGYADNGFYFESGGVATWIEIMNGVQVDAGSC